MREIWVYADEGAGPKSVGHTLQFLKSRLPQYRVKRCLAKDLRYLPDPLQLAMIVFPGGASLPYERKLGAIQRRSIKQFVKNGGSFLGLCAGAYFAGTRYVFDKGEPGEILSKRPLGLLPVRSVGPAFGSGSYALDGRFARAALLRLGKGQRAYFHHNGGGYFASKPVKIKIIARYEELIGQPAAVISGRVGQGRVVLSHVHFEFPNRKSKKSRYDFERILNLTAPKSKIFELQLLRALGL